LIPLEDLQAIGERYAPRVLREYFSSNGFDSLTDEGDVAFDVSRYENVTIGYDLLEIDLENLKKLRRYLIVSCICFTLLLVVSVLIFIIQCPVTDDPIDLPTVIGDSVPRGLCLYIGILGIFGSLYMEIFACMHYLTWKYLSKIRRFILFSLSFFGRTGSILDFMAFTVIVKSAPKMAQMGCLVFFIQIVIFGLILPIRALLSIIRPSDFSGRGNPCVPRDLIAATSPDEPPPVSLPPKILDAVTCRRPTDTGILKLVNFSSITGHYLVHHILIQSYSSIPMQTDSMVKSYTFGYFSCLSYQLMIIPVKIFFILDYGWNWVVAVSGLIGLFVGALNFLTTVFPLQPDNVLEFEQEDETDREMEQV
jgi:hypothetical protein